jgi:cell division septation protein DedD
MHRDDIADIVVPEEKKNSFKGILTIVSLIIIVFIVGVALSDMVVDDPQKDELSVENNETVMMNPELTLKETTKKEDTKDIEDIENDSDISNLLKEKLDKPMEFPVESNKGVRDETVTLDSQDTDAKKENTESKTAKDSEDTKVDEKDNASTQESTESKESVEEKVESVKKVTTSKPKPKPVKRTPSRASGNYYIQAGAFKNAPSKRLLSSIKNNGYRYTTKTSNGVTKLLIGPYKSRASANRVLGRVKDRIVKSAYIIKK